VAYLTDSLLLSLAYTLTLLLVVGCWLLRPPGVRNFLRSLRSGVKYMVVRSYPNGSSDDGLATIYFKKPRGGGCFVVTNQAAIIGTFDEGKGQTASQCNFAVEALGRYLYSSGY
jgi:hypothetical protein